MTMRNGLAAGVVLALLAGCSSSPDMRMGLNTAVEAVTSMREQRNAAPLQPVGTFPGLDPALLAGRNDSMMGAYLQSSGAVAGLIPAGQSGSYISWRTADGVGLTLVGGGLATSSRGLGMDLHAADVAQSAALITAGRAGTAQRRHVYLDGIYRQTSMRFDCTIQPGGSETLVLNGQRRDVVRIDERCQGEGQSFANIYWRDARSPLIRQSLQWLGPELGSVHLQRLID